MILAIIQARISSSRLPGKVLLPIAEKPVLQWVYDAAQISILTDGVVVATSWEDAQIATYCRNRAIPYFLGSLENVLDRFYRAALSYKPAHIVRLTADCPMSSPKIIDEVIRFHLKGGYDYTTNSGFQGSYPDGLDVEVFSMDALTRAAKLAYLPYDLEHVTPFMRDRDMFRIGRVYCPDPSMVGKKYSVDTQEDYERVKGEMECLLAQRNCLPTH